MQTSLVIDFAHTAPSASVEDAVRAGTTRLSRSCPELTDCHATISGPCDGHHLAEPVHVHLHLSLPGTQFEIDQPLAGREDTPTAVEEAFDAAERRLASWKRHTPAGACA